VTAQIGTSMAECAMSIMQDSFLAHRAVLCIGLALCFFGLFFKGDSTGPAQVIAMFVPGATLTVLHVMARERSLSIWDFALLPTLLVGAGVIAYQLAR